METTLKPYPAKKDSGLDWIGVIPEHWEVSRNGRLFSQRIETGKPELPVLEVSLKTGVRVRDLEGGVRKQAMADRSMYKVAMQGDIAYNMMRMWQGAVGVAPADGLISPAYVVARPRGGVDTRYFAYLFRTGAYMEEVNRRSRGIVSDRNRLYWQDFKQLPSLSPPPVEQAQIASYLDAHGRAVGRLVRTKQRLIALLNEQKQAIIQLAVTRGLDPDVPLKPSGVDWLDYVPEHWGVVSLGRLLRYIEQGWSPNAAEGKLREGQWSVLALSAVKGGHFRSHESKPLPLATVVPSQLEIKRGDFLLTRSNTRSLVGDVCVVGETHPRLMLSDLIYRLAPEAALLWSKFLMYQLMSPFGRAQIEADARGSSSTMVKVSQGHIKRWVVCLPPIDEQVDIAARLDAEVAEIDDAISTVSNEIHLIREYRTRLVADVVTGKLDVRGFAVPEVGGDGAAVELDVAEDDDEPILDEEALAPGEA